MRVLVWNIETFGAPRTPVHDASRIDFVARVVAQQGADVLVIQELCAGGVALLPMLQAALNALAGGGGPWWFDWLPAAITTPPAAAAGLAFANLGFAGAANSEGYAVFWRGASLAAIPGAPSFNSTLPPAPPAPAPPPPACIDLVTTGRQPVVNPHLLPPITATPPGPPDVALGFPIRYCSTIATTPKRTRSGAFTDPLGTIVGTLNVRRPCVVRLNLAGGATVPLVVYHAPNGSEASYYGTLIAGLSTALQPGGPPASPAIVAGDFNVTNVVPLRTAFSNFLATAMTDGTLAAGGGGAHVPSMVRYATYGVPRTLTANTRAGCQGSARDELFYRLPAPRLYASSGVVDLLGMLMAGGGAGGLPPDPAYQPGFAGGVMASGPIGAQAAALIAALPALVAASPPTRAAFTAAWPAAGVGALTDYLSVAIFLRELVSDHLPLWIQFT